ncbi:hypothetical protein HDV00_008342 [Rhizophlyctis rosea]|nr:hypothetical protein HDV00_008342 [Rhizophlyctis rosea]
MSVGVWSSWSLTRMLTTVNLNRLRHFSLVGNQGVDPIWIDLVPRAFTKAAATGSPLQLQSFTLKGPKIAISCAILPFLQLLQSSLRRLDIQILNDNVYHQDDSWKGPLLIIPTDISFKSLRSLQLSSRLIFENLATSAPNLEAISITSVHRTLSRNDRTITTLRLDTLTQSTLTQFDWGRMGWERSLAYIPTATLMQLTSIDINCQFGGQLSNEYVETFCRPLNHLHALTSFKVLRAPFSCKDIETILKRIPGRLETFWLGVGDWKYDVVQSALEGRAGLKDVWIDTAELVYSDYPERFDVEARRMNEMLRIREPHFSGRNSRYCKNRNWKDSCKYRNILA